MKKINVLIITTYFTPIQHIASNRINSFAKYLDKEKYNIYVLSLESGCASTNIRDMQGVNVTRIKNRTLLKRASISNKDGLVVHKLKALYNIFLNKVGIDPYCYWVKECIVAARRIIDKYGIDAMISSYGPLAPHQVALSIKRTNHNIKWIADMRDEFPTNPHLRFTQRTSCKQVERLESEILEWADAITAVSKPILDYYKLRSGGRAIYEEIRNGYDFELPSIDKASDHKTFRISYLGSLYGDSKADNFLKALEVVYSSYNIDFCFELVGSNVNLIEIPRSIKSRVSIVSKVPHEQAIQKMIDSDLLLLIIPSNKREGVYTGKLFEYLGSLTPILALVPPHDVAAKLISDCNAGYIVDYDDHKGIVHCLLQAYENWVTDTQPQPNIEVIKKHHRKEQVQRMDRLIQKLVGEHYPI